MGAPVGLIHYDQNSGKFEVGKEAMAILRRIKGPVGVAAVCGRARQGKSFILNQLLETSSGGFQVAPTHRPCTKGLWMWSTPQKLTAADGSAYHLILLDTEGIDAYDQTTQYSTQIFSLAVLLSSLFVYNQMGGIDEAALDRLSLVTEMTKHIRVRAGSTAVGEELREFTPSFMWLLRDFYLQLEEEGRKITPRDYLETALFPVPSNGPAADAKNAIRSSIKALFPDRDCFTLVRPMHDEAALVNLDKIDKSQLRPEFKEGVRQLIRLIIGKAHPKRFGSSSITGPVFAGLTEAYVKAINEGAVPTIATAWQGVAEMECRRAADTAESTYMQQFDQEVAAEEAALEQEHQRCLAEGLTVYADNAVGDEHVRRVFEDKFRGAAAAKFADMRARKLAEASAHVNELLLSATAELSGIAARPNSSLGDVNAALQQFLERFAKSAAGPTKWLKLAEFLKGAYPAVAEQMMARQQQAAGAELERLREDLGASERRGQHSRQRAEQAEARCSAQDAQLGELNRLVVDKTQELGRLRAQSDERGAKVAALEAQLREAHLVNERKVQGAVDAAEAQLRSVALEAQASLAEVQAALEDERRRAQALAAELSALQSRSGGLEAQLQALQGERGDISSKLGQVLGEKSELVRQLEAARCDVQARTRQAEVAELERDEALKQVAELQQQLASFDQRMEQELQEADQQAASQPVPAAAGSLSRDQLVAMTIPSMKAWLTQHGFDQEAWAMSTRKPAAKKAEWAQLVQEKAGTL